MDPANTAPGFRIWAVDNVVYGPVELPMLVAWVQEERVTAGTWVYCEAREGWEMAGRMPELQMFFSSRLASEAASESTLTSPEGTPIRPGALRRLKVFAAMSDPQIQQFIDFMQVQRVRQWEEIVREGSPGDAMFLILEGEVRVRLMIAARETILATLPAGEFFGEVALFDQGPRSADVVANRDCLLLKIPTGSFQRLIQEAADLAAPFLHAIGRTLIARIRADNKRYRDSIAFARSVNA